MTRKRLMESRCSQSLTFHRNKSVRLCLNAWLPECIRKRVESHWSPQIFRSKMARGCSERDILKHLATPFLASVDELGWPYILPSQRIKTLELHCPLTPQTPGTPDDIFTLEKTKSL